MHIQISMCYLLRIILFYFSLVRIVLGEESGKRAIIMNEGHCHGTGTASHCTAVNHHHDHDHVFSPSRSSKLTTILQLGVGHPVLSSFDQ